MTRTDSGLAFVFPGQGSQSVGMMADLGANHPIVIKTFAEASEILGYDLWSLATQGPEEQLNATQNTQPAMLVSGVAAWRVWCDLTDLRPALMAGHSLGEFTALVCAGVISFEAGVRLVAERARFMQEAVPAGIGAMAAVIGLDDAAMVAICAQASFPGEQVWAVNFNAPGQVVIAGHKGAVEKAAELAKSTGAKRVMILPISVPCHSPLLKEAAQRFRGLLDQTAISPAQQLIIHNVDVSVHEGEEAVRDALEQQLFGSVRWTETILAMADRGVTTYVECGPGKTLAGLIKRIAPDARIENIFDSSSLEKARGLAA